MKDEFDLHLKKKTACRVDHVRDFLKSGRFGDTRLETSVQFQDHELYILSCIFNEDLVLLSSNVYSEIFIYSLTVHYRFNKDIKTE